MGTSTRKNRKLNKRVMFRNNIKTRSNKQRGGEDTATIVERIRNGDLRNLQDADLQDADLQGANLQGADLSGADLSGADLQGADLSGADLKGVILQGANLQGADLTVAELTSAVLTGANLTGANLQSVDLSDAVLTGVNLQGADLSGANLDDAIFQGVNLEDAIFIGVENIDTAYFGNNTGTPIGRIIIDTPHTEPDFAYEIHNAYENIDINKYLNYIIPEEEDYQDIYNTINNAFTLILTEIGKNSDKETITKDLKIKLDNLTHSIQLANSYKTTNGPEVAYFTIKYLTKKNINGDFVNFRLTDQYDYVKSWIDQNTDAYGKGGASCITGMFERFVSVLSETIQKCDDVIMDATNPEYFSCNETNMELLNNVFSVEKIKEQYRQSVRDATINWMNDNDTDPLYDSNPTDDEIKKSYMIYLKRELIHDDYDTYINNGLISNDVINTFRGSIGGGYKGHAKKGGKPHKKKKTKKNHTKKGGKTKQRRTKNKRR